MTTPNLADAVARADATGLDPAAIEVLRAALNGADAGGAAALLALDGRRGGDACEAWPDFLSEAVSWILLGQAEPEGYVAPAQAAAIASHLSAEPTGAAGRAALLRVLRSATSVPDSLARCALEAVAAAIGPAVGAADVDALRTCLYASSGEGFGFVTRAEAEVLFAVADATRDADNDSAFDDLFARAVGNHLLAAGGQKPPSVSDALARRLWLDTRRPLPDGLSAMFAGCLTGVLSGDTFTGAAGWRATRAAEETVAPMLAGIDEGEAAWVLERIRRDGVVSRAERRLVAFIRHEAPALPASLRPLLDLAA